MKGSAHSSVTGEGCLWSGILCRIHSNIWVSQFSSEAASRDNAVMLRECVGDRSGTLLNVVLVAPISHFITAGHRNFFFFMCSNLKTGIEKLVRINYKCTCIFSVTARGSHADSFGFM